MEKEQLLKREYFRSQAAWYAKCWIETPYTWAGDDFRSLGCQCGRSTIFILIIDGGTKCTAARMPRGGRLPAQVPALSGLDVF
jgi:hypothetical protein